MDRIDKLDIRLLFPSGKVQEQALSEAERIYSDCVSDAISAVFDRFSGRDISLGAVEVDLGVISPPDIPYALSRELERILSEAAVSLPSSEESPLREYLKTGVVSRSYALIPSKEAPEGTIYRTLPPDALPEFRRELDSVLSDPAAFTVLAAEFRKDRRSFRRFIDILDTTQLLQLYGMLSNHPESAARHRDESAETFQTGRRSPAATVSEGGAFTKEHAGQLSVRGASEREVWNIPMEKHPELTSLATADIISDPEHAGLPSAREVTMVGVSIPEMASEPLAPPDVQSEVGREELISRIEEMVISDSVSPSERDYRDVPVLSEVHDEDVAIGDERIHVDDAGIVIISPFLPRLFANLGYLDDAGTFADFGSRLRAVHLVRSLAYGFDERHTENRMVLAKILCGLPLLFPLGPEFKPEEKEKQEAAELLETVRSYWKSMKNTSVEGMTETFIRRHGSLEMDGNGWLLRVEGKACDILMDEIPWGFTTFLPAWNELAIFTEWQKEY